MASPKARNSVSGFFDRLRQVFNLNDPRWGRGEGDGKETPPNVQGSESDRGNAQNKPGHRQESRNAPPDLDEVWRDFSKKLAGFFGKKPKRPAPSNNGARPPKNIEIGRPVWIVAVIILIVLWLGSGFFIVQEGQQAVVTRFGQYQNTVGAGVNWRMPWPLEQDDVVNVTQIRSVDVGSDELIKASGLRDSAMLTKDENILEVKFAVQYRLNNARDWLFTASNPEATVTEAARTAIRQVLGGMKMDQALAEDRDQIAPQVRTIMQAILDNYKVGVDVVAINLRQSGVRPPDQVQGAFDDVLKAEQETERVKNEAQAYANNVVPRAKGAAARLQEEAQGYQARVVAQAEGDANRFNSILIEYQKAPQVTKERMYLEAMQRIYSNANKVIVDGKQGSNLLYLPLDKLMQNNKRESQNSADSDVNRDSVVTDSDVSSGNSVSQQSAPNQSIKSKKLSQDSNWVGEDRERDRDFRQR